MRRKTPLARKPSRGREIFSVLLMVLVLLGLVALPLARGALFYETYWGAAVFIPFVLIFVIIAIAIGIKGLRRK